MEKLMTIREVSEMLGIPEHTIRYYTDQGLIPNIRRSSSNYRIFDSESIEWLKGTIYFRQLGLSIRDIIHYHDLCFSSDPAALKERYELLQAYREKAAEELKLAGERLRYLERITERDRMIAEEHMPDLKNPFLRRSAQE